MWNDECGESPLVELSLELVESPLARKMVLSVEGGPECTVVAAALAERLRNTRVGDDIVSLTTSPSSSRAVFEPCRVRP